jgi:hypothetical protein
LGYRAKLGVKNRGEVSEVFDKHVSILREALVSQRRLDLSRYPGKLPIGRRLEAKKISEVVGKDKRRNALLH